ncbi:MAG: MerR family transcriptional regulator [Firmicutes bacterium]|nr:MerR family transcriptional regulator [Bacillota bacterium]
MGVTNCPRCGKMFYPTGDDSKICPDCVKEEEQVFETLKEYLRENPGKNMADITADTGISAKKVNKFLREGRLEVTEGMEGFLTCMKCGRSITTGKYCADCASKISKKLQTAVTKDSPIMTARPGGAKMHYLSGDK